MTTPPGVGESTDSSYVNVEQQEQPTITPVSGYAWNKRKGYFLLPESCYEDPSGTKIWHHDSKTYKTVIGDDLWDDESAQASDAGWSDKSHNKPHNKKRDGDIPEWDGKSACKSV